MATQQNIEGVYIDNVPDFAARQYPGCFTVAQVQERLDQPIEAMRQRDHGVHLSLENDDAAGVLDSHFLPGCMCSALHARCGGSPAPQEPAQTSIEVTLEQLRMASEAGCWFCSVIYGGFIAAPSWDPGRKVKTPMLSTFQLCCIDGEGQYFSVNLFELRDPALIFYVRETEGTAPSLTSREPADKANSQLFTLQTLQSWKRLSFDY